MAKRTDNLQENGFYKAITDLETQINEFKSRQKTSGRSGVIGYLSQSDSTWDYVATIGSDSDTSSRITNLNATFTADGSQVVTIANLTFVLFANGTDSAHQLTPQNPTWTSGSHYAFVSYGGITEGKNTYTYSFSVTTTLAVTLYAKAYATGSSRGTVTVGP